MLRRFGSTLLELLVTIAVLAAIGGVIYINQSRSSTQIGSDVERIDRASRVLAELADAIGRTTGTGGVTSFNQVIGQANATVSANVGRLSQLTTPITTSDVNSCLYNYTSAEAGRWATPFYYRFIPQSGFLIAPGFLVQDSLIRYNNGTVALTIANRPAANDASSFGTLAMVMPNTSRADADAMAARVEGDQSGVQGAVRYNTSGTGAVTLYYHFTVRGC